MNSKIVIKRDKTYLLHICEGCDEEHLIPMGGKNPWSFNKDFIKPTLSPSVKHTMERDGVIRICHYFIRNGMIEYCGDSQHKLAGKTVALTPYKNER